MCTFSASLMETVHGIYCYTACGELFKKAAKRANITGSNDGDFGTKRTAYRVFRRSDWQISYTRLLSLLQWVTDNPAHATNKRKKAKRKSKSPLRHPRDKKKYPSKQKVLDKL